MVLQWLILLSPGGCVILAETAVGVSNPYSYPYASENHQEYNARLWKKRAAKVYLEKELNGGMLLDAVKSVLHTDVLAAMAAQSWNLGKLKPYL